MSPQKTKNENRGWKILFSYLIKYQKNIFLLSVLGVITATASAFSPFIIGKFFDSISSTQSIEFVGLILPKWAFFLLIWLFLTVIANTIDWIIDNKARLIGTYLPAIYPAEAIKHLLHLPISFHKEHKIGVIWDKFARAGNNLANIIENIVITLTPQLLSVFIGLIIALYINIPLGGVLIFGMIIYILSLTQVVPPIVKLQRLGNRAWNRAYGDAYDVVSNISTIKQATAESYAGQHVFNRFVNGAARTWYKVEKIWNNINFLQRAVVALTRMTIFIVSVYFIHSQIITLGELVAFNVYSMMIFQPISQIARNWQVIQNGIVALERAQKILDLPEENVNRKSLLSPKITGEVEFQGVYFKYKKNKDYVLNNVSFKINQGDTVALVGESGVGKSTLIDLISGYYFPQKGRVLISGIDTRKLDLYSLREKIAVVPQEVVLFNDTIKNNIKYGKSDIKEKTLIEATRIAHADEFIEKFPNKLNQIVGERGVKLSVGQKQRIAIARAVLRSPSILVLDEPTSALDSKTERNLTESLEFLMRGRTTFIIAHRLSTVRKAHKIIVLEGGSVAEIGSHDELMSKTDGVYKKLYELHIGLK